MVSSSLTRRCFTAGVLASPVVMLGQDRSDSEMGSLYPQIQGLADSSPLKLSYVRPEFDDLRSWQDRARTQLLELLQYTPPQVSPEVARLEVKQRDGYTEERLTFRTTPNSRVPATLLIPSGRKQRAPGVVVLHDHGGFYMWGREKVTATDNENPVLSKFKQQFYSGRSIANELVRQGYAVIAIDIFYWGERRFLLKDDPPSWRDRSSATEQQVNAFNRRAAQNEQLIDRALLTAGVTWPGVMLWDDLRTADYLASRPEVDANRLACVGLSLGGYRSFVLGALDPRMKAAIDVGWMTAFTTQIEHHIVNTMGLTFTIPGMYRYFDLPDLAALIAPRALLVMMGSRDGLFPQRGIQAAFARIEACYRKAGVPDRQSTRLFDAPHEFNAEMQKQAWEWLRRWV